MAGKIPVKWLKIGKKKVYKDLSPARRAFADSFFSEAERLGLAPHVGELRSEPNSSLALFFRVIQGNRRRNSRRTRRMGSFLQLEKLSVLRADRLDLTLPLLYLKKPEANLDSRFDFPHGGCIQRAKTFDETFPVDGTNLVQMN
jgi:hypothetical protein